MAVTSTSTSSPRLPGLWQGLAWALRADRRRGGISRPRLAWRTLAASLAHPKAMRRWMAVAYELHARGIAPDLESEYLRAVQPYIHRDTDVIGRVLQLIDHVDWLETAFKPAAFRQLASGALLVLAELPAPRGFEYMRLQLQRAPAQSPEGELLLTLTLRRAPDVQIEPKPVDAAAMCFSRFRIDGQGCLVIGGVRGQRHPVLRMSVTEMNQALAGWKPAVLMVRVAQELARHWGLQLVGLDPRAHRLQGWAYRWSRRYREAAQRIDASYDALWQHFGARQGPPGWMVVPLNSDDKLEATALSPEKRERQTRRADYWIRIRNLLRLQFRDLLLRPGREARLSRMTQGLAPDTFISEGEEYEFDASEDPVPARVLQTGPGSLM